MIYDNLENICKSFQLLWARTLWTSVKRGNQRIITCYSVHLHEKKRRQLFYLGNMCWVKLLDATERNRKLLRL